MPPAGWCGRCWWMCASRVLHRIRGLAGQGLPSHKFLQQKNPGSRVFLIGRSWSLGIPPYLAPVRQEGTRPRYGFPGKDLRNPQARLAVVLRVYGFSAGILRKDGNTHTRLPRERSEPMTTMARPRVHTIMITIPTVRSLAEAPGAKLDSSGCLVGVGVREGVGVRRVGVIV